jgi:lysophospholipase L1-like esterase
MIDCLIVGDSIAVGTAMARKECVSYSKGGWNSWQLNKDYLSKVAGQPARTLIISLGANDHRGVKTEFELRKMRESVKADRVFWIDPGQERKPIAHDAIVRIAKEYGDTVLPRPRDHMSGDGVHPTGRGYKILGDQTR